VDSPGGSLAALQYEGRRDVVVEAFQRAATAHQRMGGLAKACSRVDGLGWDREDTAGWSLWEGGNGDAQDHRMAGEAVLSGRRKGTVHDSAAMAVGVAVGGTDPCYVGQQEQNGADGEGGPGCLEGDEPHLGVYSAGRTEPEWRRLPGDGASVDDGAMDEKVCRGKKDVFPLDLRCPWPSDITSASIRPCNKVTTVA
jgi:hypothetical protein